MQYFLPFIEGNVVESLMLIVLVRRMMPAQCILIMDASACS